MILVITGTQTEVKTYNDCAMKCNLLLAPPLHDGLEFSCSDTETSVEEPVDRGRNDRGRRTIGL